MNNQDREQMGILEDKINKLDHKIDGIYDALLDDKRTSKIGIISEVNQMKKDIEVIMSAYKVGKWLTLAIVTSVLGLLGHYIIKN